jgi:ABC-type multidrug transport system permease subunit
MSKPNYRRQLIQLIIAHTKEISREPAVLFWGIIFPILMALGLGIAFTKKTDVTRSIAVVASNPTEFQGENRFEDYLEDYTQLKFDDGSTDRQFSLTIPSEKMGNTTLLFIPSDWPEAIRLLKRGHINLILELQNDSLVYHFDPLNPEAKLEYLQLSKTFLPGKNSAPRQPRNVEPLTVSGTRYIDFLVPGLIAMGIMMSCMWGISYGMIEKRTKKLLRRMIATPMRKSNFLIALVTVRIGMNAVEAILLLIFAFLFFGISIQGSLWGLILIFLAGNIVFSGLAILVSSRTANTEIGNGLINAVVLPMMVLSGIFFSYHNFPDWAVVFIKKLPLTMLTDNIRGIFIEGLGFSEVLLPSIILFALGITFFSAGLKYFRWY